MIIIFIFFNRIQEEDSDVLIQLHFELTNGEKIIGRFFLTDTADTMRKFVRSEILGGFLYDELQLTSAGKTIIGNPTVEELGLAMGDTIFGMMKTSKKASVRNRSSALTFFSHSIILSSFLQYILFFLIIIFIYFIRIQTWIWMNHSFYFSHF